MDFQKIPRELVTAITDHRCVLFAGAGLSRGEVEVDVSIKEQSLPTWDGLLEGLVDRGVELEQFTPGQAKRLRQAAKDEKYLFAAEVVKRNLGGKEFDETLERIFRNPSLKPTNRIRLVTDIPFAGVITTNYDKLIEMEYSSKGLYPPVYTYDNSPDVISSLSTGRFLSLRHTEI